MDYVTQAYSLCKTRKSQARKIYREALFEIIKKDQSPLHDNVFINLSTIFALKWINQYIDKGEFPSKSELYAEASIAFNYANLDVISKGNIFSLINHQFNDKDRLGDEEILKIMDKLCFTLTNTTAIKVREKLLID